MRSCRTADDAVPLGRTTGSAGTGQVDVHAEDVGRVQRLDGDLAADLLAGCLADPDVRVAQLGREVVGGLVEVSGQGRQVGDGAIGEVDRLVGRDVAPGLGGCQVHGLLAGEPVGIFGAAPVGEQSGVLGDELAGGVA